jgi:ferredoxin
MALLITEDCTNCEACVAECPNEAIAMGKVGIYAIDALRCTECVGANDEPQCQAACPAECIVSNPDFPETREELEEKYRQLHA